MDSQAAQYKEAIMEILLKRIIPLEKQLEAQSATIDELSNSLEALTKILMSSQEPPPKKLPLPAPPVKRNSMVLLEEQRLREQKKKELDLQEIKKAFVLGISKLNRENVSDEKKISKEAGEPESEIEDDVENEEELQLIDIEMNQLGDFSDDQIPEFFYNDLSLGAIATLAELSKAELELTENPPPKVKWILRLFWQLQGIEVNALESCKRWKEFISSNIGQLEETFFRLRNSLNFSMQNLDKLETLLRHHKNLLNPSLFGYCPVASHLMAVIKNIIDYSGVISAASAMRYKRLLYKKKQYS